MPQSCLEGAHYIDEMWMFWGAVPAVVALFRMFDLRKANITTIFGWLLMPLFAMHQFEAHGFDFYGVRYNFVKPMNDIFESLTLPMEFTPRLVTIINVSFLWILCPICAFLTEKTGNPIYVLHTWSFAFINILLSHCLPSLIFQTYRAGMLSAALMVPIGMFFYTRFFLKYGERTLLWFWLFGFAHGHILCIIMPLMLFTIEIINEIGYAMCFPGVLSVFLYLGSTYLHQNDRIKSL